MTATGRQLPSLCASIAAALLVACSDDARTPLGPDDFGAVVSPAAQWPGKQITLRWGWLAGHEPSFAMGDSSLSWTRVDDSTATLTLPSFRDAAIRQLEAVEEDGARTELSAVTMPGLLEQTDLPIGVDCVPHAWPRSSPSGFLGCGPGGELTLVSPGGGVHPFPGVTTSWWPLGYGTSYREHVILAPGAGPGEVVAWDLTGGTSTLLGPVGVTSLGGTVFELGPDRWLLMEDLRVAVVAAADTTWLDVRNPRRVVFSPESDRAVLLADSTAGGMAIVDIAAGTVAQVAGVHFAHKAAFSADGSSLWVAGGADYHDEMIYRMDPAIGTVLQEAEPPGLTIELVLDAEVSLLYASADISDGYYMRALDPTTLAEIAMVGPATYGLCGGCSVHHAAFVDPMARRLHTLDYADVLWSFALLP